MRDRLPRHLAAKVNRTVRLGGRTCFLLEQLNPKSIQHGKRYRAFLPSAGPKGGYRAVHIFNKSETSLAHIDVLQKLDDHGSVTSLPRIDEYHEQGHEVFVVLRWVRGHTLREHLEGARRVHNEGHKGISPREAMKLFVGLAHALAHLHRHVNMVHGDVKPENLIVHPRPNRLVMIDFGSAWLVHRTMRRGPRDGFDLHYAAPELHAGGFADSRADLFSASMILYEMLTLQLPYDGAGGQAGLESAREAYKGSYTPPSVVCGGRGTRPAFWRIIDQFLATGLQLDADRRFQTPREWLDAVDGLRKALADAEAPGAMARAAMALGAPVEWLRRRLR